MPAGRFSHAHGSRATDDTVLASLEEQLGLTSLKRALEPFWVGLGVQPLWVSRW